MHLHRRVSEAGDQPDLGRTQNATGSSTRSPAGTSSPARRMFLPGLTASKMSTWPPFLRQLGLDHRVGPSGTGSAGHDLRGFSTPSGRAATWPGGMVSRDQQTDRTIRARIHRIDGSHREAVHARIVEGRHAHEERRSLRPAPRRAQKGRRGSGLGKHSSPGLFYAYDLGGHRCAFFASALLGE